MNLRTFISELKRRNIYKVAVAYAVVAWLLIQAASILFPTFEAPAWVMKVFVTAIILGFPIALIVAWAFEITPEGIVRAEDVPPNKSITRETGRKLVGITVAVALIATALLGWQFLRPKTGVLASAPAGPAPAAAVAPAPAAVTEKSIAVLPFDNLSRDPDNAFFAEGVQDEILTRLAKVADLKVISRTSTQRFKSSPNDLPAIAKQLGVFYILEGSVQKSGDAVRVNVQLINAATDAHLWAEIYDRKLTDIFAVESDIAKTIADQLQAKLTGSEKKLIASQPTSDTAAYELYHKGRSLFDRRSADNLRKAIEFYEQAAARDPNYALAYAGISEAYSILPGYAAAAPKEVAPKAKAAAVKALQLDNQLAEAHNAMAQALFAGDLNIEGAIAEFRRAIALNPNYATAHHWLGNGPLVCVRRFDEGLVEAKRAVELDPLSSIVEADLGVTLLYARRYDEAIAAFRKASELDPKFYYPYLNIGLALQMKGDIDGALREYKKAMELDDDPFVAVLNATAEAKAGDHDAIPRMLRQLDEIGTHRYVAANWRAVLYAHAGDTGQAMHWLEQMYADRDGGGLASIAVDPAIDPIRADPRFQAFEKKVFSGPLPP